MIEGSFKLIVNIAYIISCFMAICLICSPFLAVLYKVCNKKTVTIKESASLLFASIPIWILIVGIKGDTWHLPF